MSPEARRLLAAAAIFIYALGLRVTLLGRHPFHMDEALYAGFSDRIAHGDLLLTGGLNNDKPPLQFYLGAIGLGLFGHNESAVRVMDSLVSALECGVLAWFLWPLAGAGLSLAAALLLAGSPVALAYGPSGLMDGPMSLFLLLAFCLAASGRSWGAGLAWGLAVASKQTAGFLAPLIVLAVWLAASAPKTALKRFGAGAAWVVMPLFLWSLLFQHPRLGMVFLMKANQPEVGLGAAGLDARFENWLLMAGGTYAWPWLFYLTLMAGMSGSAWLLWRWQKMPERRAWALAGSFVPSCLILFAGLNMRPFDRYLLPLASFGALALALPFGELVKGFRGLRYLGLPLIAVLLITNRSVVPAPTSQGVAFAANDGFDKAALEMKKAHPLGGTVVSGDGAVQWMASFYLNKDWRVLAAGSELGQDPGLDLCYLGRVGDTLPNLKGRAWHSLGRFENWELFEATHGGKA